MKNLTKLNSFLILLLALFFTAVLEAQGVRVRGYTRKDGTYVSPHYRSAPDGNFNNNWSTKGNVNPHTGEAGTEVAPNGVTRAYPGNPNSYALDMKLEEAKRMVERKAYWTAQGWDVSKVNCSNSYALDMKLEEAKRALLWRSPNK